MAADAKITFNTAVNADGFDKGVEALSQKTGSLEKVFDGVNKSITSAFDPEQVDNTSSAIMKQQAVVDGLRAKLADITTIEANTSAINQLERDIGEAASEAGRLERSMSDMQKSLEEPLKIVGLIDSLDETVAKQQESLSLLSALKETYPQLELPPNLQAEFDGVSAVVDGLDAKTNKLKDLLQGVEIPDVAIESFSLASGKVELLSAKAKDLYSELAKTTEIDVTGFESLDDALDSVYNKAQQSIGTLNSEIATTAEKCANAYAHADELREAFGSIQMPEQPKKSAEELSQALAIATKKLDEMKSKTKNTSSAMDGLGKSVEKTINRIKGLVVGAFVFNVLRSALKQFREYVIAAAMENEAFARSFNQFKANIAAAVQPLLNALIPALTRVASALAYIAGIIAQIVATITGANIQSMYAQAEARDKQTKANQAQYQKELEAFNKKQAQAAVQRSKEEEREIARIAKELEKQEKAQAANADKHAKAVEKQAKEQQRYLDKIKKSNKELDKTTASFDDLITLSSAATEELDNMAPEGLFDEIPFEELEFEDITSKLTDAIAEGFNDGFQAMPTMYDNLAEPAELTQHIKDVIGTIMAILGGALLVVGAILVFTGVNIPVGLAMMVAGALLLYAALKEEWGLLPSKMQDTIAIIAMIVGGALIVIGCILVFTGANIPIGLALIVAGAIMMATAIAARWNEMPENIKNIISIVMAIVGGALFVIGLILVLTGAAAPLGLGLMVAGAALLGAAAALNWDKLPESIKTVISIILGILSVAALVLGALLCFTSVNIPLGIALIAAGAAGIAGVIALNWDKLGGDIKNVIGVILAIVGPAMLVLGIILCFTAVALPIAIALIAAGAAALVGAVALNWDSIKDKVKNVLATIAAIAAIGLLALGCILLAVGLIPLGIGLIVAGIALSNLAKEHADEDNKIVAWVTGVFDKVKKIIVDIIIWLVEKVDSLKEGFSRACEGIGNFFKNLWEGIVEGASNAWNWVLDGVKWLWDGFVEILNKIGTFFSDVWEGIKKGASATWEGMKEGLKWAINGIIDLINGMLNAIGNGLNAVINAMNKLQFDIPDWLGGGTFGINIQPITMPQIPRLAQGAVLPGGSPFMAVVNDQPRGQTNVEAPLATIQEAVATVFEQYMNQMGDNAYILKADAGDLTGFFRMFNLELQRANSISTAFA